MTDTEIQHQQFYVTQVFEIMEKTGMAIQMINATHLPDMNIRQLAKRWDMSVRTITNKMADGAVDLKIITPTERKKGRELVIDGLSIQIAEQNHAERTIVKMNI